MSAAFVALGLAAALGLAGCRSPTPLPAVPPPPPELVSPRGPTAWPFSFVWKRDPGDAWICRIRVIDRAERVLYDHETRGATTLRPPDDLQGTLSGDATFTWQIAVIGPDGKEVTHSETVAFSLRQPPGP